MFKIKFGGKIIEASKNKSFYEILKENNIKGVLPTILIKIDNDYYELTEKVCKSGDLKLINITDDLGMMSYIRTLQFILIKAVDELFKHADVNIEHSLGKGLYGEIYKNGGLTKEDINKIKQRMNEIIQRDIPIKKISMERCKAIKIFEDYNMEDKVRLLNHVNRETIKLYELNGRYDYFYGPMAFSTGVINKFDLMLYGNGFILQFPERENPNLIPVFINHKKLAKIFDESEEWGKILDVAHVGALNDKVDNKDIYNIILISEALHEKKLAYIADKIHEDKDIKVILIAGPSSSGKTTFARRLGIQLRVNGLMPVAVSLDDYFLNREDTPKDENGNYDFESIRALDLELFNTQMTDLLNGEEIDMPTFDFKEGKKKWNGKMVKLPPNGVLIIEGIHGLNEVLTSSIPKKNKFKIYVSALTQLNLDRHNRIATTDVRKIRRIVRDYLSRGYSAEETLKMWSSIKIGEEKNIFSFQEEADIMFNSTLVYELCILKKYALKELENIDENSEVYYEALRLMSFLRFFKELDEKNVPSNSILREFIGGSCFYRY